MDPYFVRLAGADQVPPLPRGMETAVLAPENEPEIVRDYRLRNQMITLERAFQLSGRLGIIVAIIAVGILSSRAGMAIREGEVFIGSGGWHQSVPFVWLRRHAPWLLVLWQHTPWILAAATFGWLCRALEQGRRLARIILTLEPIPALAATAFDGARREIFYLVLASAAFLLLFLWRPRGRLYFSEPYRALVARTPAVIVPRDAGRGLATALFSAILVIQYAIFILMDQWLAAD